MGFLEALLCLAVSVAVTGAFLLYFTSSIVRPLFSVLKNREFESALTSLFLFGMGVSGANVAVGYLNVGFFRPLLQSALTTLNAVFGALMTGLPILGLFFVGHAIMTHASALSGKPLNYNDGNKTLPADGENIVEAETSK